MKTARNRALAGIAAAALIFSFSACSNDEGTEPSEKAELSGTINGSGASSQVNAQQAWRDNFTKDTGVVVNYDPTGSGTGRDQFLAGEVVFAGTDSMLDDEELAKANERCGDSGVIELPLYISPIAIAFNLEGVDSLNMDAKTIAGIFDGKITKWNDEAIAAANPDVKLPDAEIIPVNRADKSGTTENFQQYLVEAAGDAWPYEADDVWPKDGTQAAEKTSGVVNLVKSTENAITYADASQIGDLGTVAVKVGDDYLEYSPEAAAAIVDGSEPTANATDQILTVDLKRDGSVKDAYPVVLISYLVACTQYDDASTAANVKAYFEYMASADGQEVAAKANGGNAPISDDLRDKAMSAIAKIAAAK